MKTPALHIYLVEAENYARQVVARWLRDRGHRVSLLSAPEELLDILAADPDPTDLIIADLPPGQGETLSAGLRRVHQRYPLVPVLLRASSALLPATEAAHCGVYGYLSKPFRPAELELALIRLAERQASHSLQEAQFRAVSPGGIRGAGPATTQGSPGSADHLQCGGAAGAGAGGRDAGGGPL
ncbi:MAG: response regulator [Candidatus Latescibacteria bacterium]|nr:response regulator [Candidatus Latescibacterota bacterium]